ncbi:ras and EF-hand domain-containing protein-like [Pangshura tecta]
MGKRFCAIPVSRKPAWAVLLSSRFRSITKSYFRQAHGVLLVCDVASESGFLHGCQWIGEIQATEGPVPLMLIGNKMDLRLELLEAAGVRTVQGEKLAMAYNSLFCGTSAKDGTNAVEAVLHLAREVKKTVEPSEDARGTLIDLSAPARQAPHSSCCGT